MSSSPVESRRFLRSTPPRPRFSGPYATALVAAGLAAALVLAAPSGNAKSDAAGTVTGAADQKNAPAADKKSAANPAEKKEKQFGSSAVATEHPLVTRAALTILEQGGNAVDAAVAAALMAGVVAPSSSGLGGGGFALVHAPNLTTPVIFDFRETAPRGVDAALLDSRPLPPEKRGALVGVPGEARGLEALQRRFGRLSFAKLVAPAEQRARLGYALGAHLARALSGGGELTRDAGLSAIFFPGGRAAIAGQVVKNPKLAKTLARLAKEGSQILYSGPIASEIARTVQSHGGPLDETDLANYAIVERAPLQVSWGDHTVFTMPAPSGGGLLLAQTLGLFSREELVRAAADLGRSESAAYTHLLAEAFRASLLDRFRYVGDPAFTPDPQAKLLDPKRLAAMRQRVALDRTHSVPLLASEEHGTHHMNFADAQGMVVALTTTVNRNFGAKLVTPDSGLVLNDQLDDFTLTRDLTRLGIREAPNAPRPGARPASSMTPTLVFRAGKPVLALGGSGGMTIGPNVAQLLLGQLVLGKAPQELVQLPRIFVPMNGRDTLLAEAGFSTAALEDLAFRGERVSTMKFTGTAVQILSWEPRGWSAAADPRKFGEAAVR